MLDPQKVGTPLQRSSLVRDQTWPSSVEYVILLILAAAVAVGTWKTFGEDVGAVLDGASNQLGGNVSEPAR